MAVRSVRIDDLTGEPLDDGEPTRFSIDGVEYEIDLSPTHEAQLRAAFKPYITATRRRSYRTTQLPPTKPEKKRA